VRSEFLCAGDRGGDTTPPHRESAEERKHRIAELEIENGFRQFDLVLDIIKTFLDPERPFALRPSIIQQLQEVAVDGIERHPGRWRTGPAGIEKSAHAPPEAHLVPFLVQEMCDYVNDNWMRRQLFTYLHMSCGG